MDYGCGKSVHTKSECRSGNSDTQRRERRKYCGSCKKDNHYEMDFYSPSRYCAICRMTNHYQKDSRYRDDRTSSTKRKLESSNKDDRTKRSRRDKDHHESRSKACFLASPKTPEIPRKIVRIKNQDKDVSKNSVKPKTSQKTWETSMVCYKF